LRTKTSIIKSLCTKSAL